MNTLLTICIGISLAVSASAAPLTPCSTPAASCTPDEFAIYIHEPRHSVENLMPLAELQDQTSTQNQTSTSAQGQKMESVIGRVTMFSPGSGITITGPQNKSYSFDLDKKVAIVNSVLLGAVVKVQFIMRDGSAHVVLITRYKPTAKVAPRVKVATETFEHQMARCGIIHGFIGATTTMIRCGVGRKPDTINTTDTAGNHHEQWVYGSGLSGSVYFYFDNGICTSTQTMN